MPREDARHVARARVIGAWGTVVVAAAGLAGADLVAAQEPVPESGFRPRIVRDGTLSLGLQGEYGSLVAGGLFADNFQLGPGIAVRVRYRTGRESAIGMSFEAQHFDAQNTPTLPEDADRLQAITTTVEYYQYFRVRRRAPRYLVAGAGLLQTRWRDGSGQTDTFKPSDGGVLTLGGGAEIWWRRTVSADLSLRYYGFANRVDGDLDLSHALQLALGFQFYTSR